MTTRGRRWRVVTLVVLAGLLGYGVGVAQPYVLRPPLVVGQDAALLDPGPATRARRPGRWAEPALLSALFAEGEGGDGAAGGRVRRMMSASFLAQDLSRRAAALFAEGASRRAAFLA